MPEAEAAPKSNDIALKIQQPGQLRVVTSRIYPPAPN